MFYKEVDKRYKEAMIAFLKKHLRYDTMNSWNKSTTYANNIKLYKFDKPAEVNSGFPIDAGGNVLFDAAVPQNDLHVWTAAAGTITVAFINVAVSSNVAQ